MDFLPKAEAYLRENPNIIFAYLFGGLTKGKSLPMSDVDIAVEVLDDKDVRIIELGTLPQFGFRKNVKINLHIFSRNKIDLNLFSNIANDIVLEGFLEVRP